MLYDEEILSKTIGRIAALESDALTMAMRLMGEDEESFSSEVREAMERWRPKVIKHLAKTIECVCVPAKELEKLEQSRRALWDIYFQYLQDKLPAQEFKEATDTMWRIANTKEWN